MGNMTWKRACLAATLTIVFILEIGAIASKLYTEFNDRPCIVETAEKESF